MWDQDFPTLFHRGGPVMWPLLGLSILLVAVLLDRAIAFSTFRSDLQGFLTRIGPHANAQRWALVRKSLGCSPLDHLTTVYLDHLETSSALRDDIVRREGMILLDHKGRRVHWLTAVGQLSPMLGLLGTVTGLVSAFHRVEVMGSRVQPSDLASGIWEALLTTVFGLVIAIPALAGRHYFQQKLDAMAREFALLITYLDEWQNGVHHVSADPSKVDPTPAEPARKVARHA